MQKDRRLGRRPPRGQPMVRPAPSSCHLNRRSVPDELVPAGKGLTAELMTPLEPRFGPEHEPPQTWRVYAG